MKIALLIPLTSVALFVSALSGCSRQPAAVAGKDLPEGTRALLERYEKVRAALAADKFDDARFQAGQLAGEAKAAIRPEGNAAVQSLADAATSMSTQSRADRLREEFKPASVAAIKLAAGSPGYFVVNCPMTKDGDWLQIDTKVSNPYFGKTMLECGIVKK